MEPYGAIDAAPARPAAKARATLAIMGACALFIAGATTMRPRTALTISDADDGMVAECSSRQEGEDFAAALGAKLLGWTALPNPVGGAFLMDRGGWAELRGGSLADYAWDYGDTGTDYPYDYTVLYSGVVHGYDAVLEWRGAARLGTLPRRASRSSIALPRRASGACDFERHRGRL